MQTEKHQIKTEKPMPNQKAIEQARTKYAEMSESDLIRITYRYLPTTVDHVAAQQLLNEKRKLIEEIRHKEIQSKLEELKKPHWTVNPNFWFTFVAAISGIIGCILTWNSAQQPKNPPINVVQQSDASTVQLTQKKTKPQQNILKPISSSSVSRGQDLRR